MGQADREPFGAHEHIGLVHYFPSVAGCWDFPFLAFYGEEGSSVTVKCYHLKQGGPQRALGLLCRA